MKKIVSFILTGIMFCVLFVPVFSASAKEAKKHNHTYYVDYIKRSKEGTEVESFGLFCEECDEVQHIKTTGVVVDYKIAYNGWGSEGKTTWYFIDGLVSLNDPIRIYGNVNIVLLDNSLLICKNGIHISSNSTLSIYSEHLDYSPKSRKNNMGKIRAFSAEDDHCAAIGGMEDAKNVTVNIYGGDFDISNNGWGAGIGSGSGKSATATVNIYNGKIYVKSINDGAGIGGGYNGTYATVNIYGGISWASVTQKFAASVGSGFWNCNSKINFYGGYIYGAPHYSSSTRYDGMIADSITNYANGNIIGNNDGIYDTKGKALAEKAGWVEENGGYVASALSVGSIWVIIAVAVVVLCGVAVLVIVKKKKKPEEE